MELGGVLHAEQGGVGDDLGAVERNALDLHHHPRFVGAEVVLPGLDERCQQFVFILPCLESKQR